MGTKFEELYDYLMTSTITDYRLDNLYKNDVDTFMLILKGYLLKATLEVSEDVITSLEYDFIEEEEYRDDELVTVKKYYFVNNLLPLEKLIFINLMAIYWYEKQTEDILEISKNIGTKTERDTNSTSTVKVKAARINELRAEVYANIRNLQQSKFSNFGWY